jgi:integrase
MARKTTGLEILKRGVRIQFMYQGKRCREYVDLGRTPDDKDIKYFENYRSGIIAEIAKGTFDYHKEFPESKNAKELSITCPITIAEFSQTYLEYIRPGENNPHALKPSTFASAKSHIKVWINPHFGDMTLGELTADDVTTVIKANTKHTNESLQTHLSTLREIFYLAIDKQLIKTHPLNNMLPIHKIRRKKTKSKTKPDPLQPEEIETLLSAMSDPIRNMFETAIWTGMRPMEYMALEWEQVDFQKRQITIDRSVVNGNYQDGTKTEAGRRKIEMLEGAYQSLLRQRKFTQMRSRFVFLSPIQWKPFRYTYCISTYWDQAINASGIRRRTQYQTRHTYASLMLTLGEDVEKISKMMGHENSILFREVYADILEGIKTGFGEKADAFYTTFFATKMPPTDASN